MKRQYGALQENKELTHKIRIRDLMMLCEARNTGSNNTAASEEHTSKRNLLTTCCLKSPDKGHGKNKNGDISKDIWDCISNVKALRHNAFRSGSMCSISRDGSTREDSHQGRCNEPHYDYCSESVYCKQRRPYGKKASIEAQN